MKLLKKLFRILTNGLSYRLGKLEEVCLTAWADALPKNERDKLLNQRKRLDFCQLQLEKKMVVFTSTSFPSRSVWPSSEKLVSDDGECLAARIVIKIEAENINAEIWIIDGVLRAIVYDKAIAKERLKAYPPLVVSVDCETRPHLTFPKILPMDYDSLFRQREKLGSQQIKIFALADFGHTPIFDSWYYILCQLGDRYYIAIDWYEKNVDPILYDFIDDEIVCSGKTIQELIDKAGGNYL
jgi:hypothetical protein